MTLREEIINTCDHPNFITLEFEGMCPDCEKRIGLFKKWALELVGEPVTHEQGCSHRWWTCDCGADTPGNDVLNQIRQRIEEATQ